MADHFSSAVDYISEALAARDHLTDLYGIPATDRDPRQVASLNGELGDALKLAEIHALLNIGQQLEDLHGLFDDRLANGRPLNVVQVDGPVTDEILGRIKSVLGERSARLGEDLPRVAP